MPQQNAEAAPREPRRTKIGGEVELVIAKQVSFDRLPVLREELEEAPYSPRLTPCSSLSRFMSRFGEPPFSMNSSYRSPSSAAAERLVPAERGGGRSVRPNLGRVDREHGAIVGLDLDRAGVAFALDVVGELDAFAHEPSSACGSSVISMYTTPSPSGYTVMVSSF